MGQATAHVGLYSVEHCVELSKRESDEVVSGLSLQAAARLVKPRLEKFARLVQILHAGRVRLFASVPVPTLNCSLRFTNAVKPQQGGDE